MPQLYGWIQKGAAQGKARTRPLPEYASALVVQGGRVVQRPNLQETRGPIWDGIPPNQ